jgi:hypothetical protein
MKKPLKRLLGFTIILTVVIGAFVPLMKASGLSFEKSILAVLAVVSLTALILGLARVLAWCFDE